ncbi:MAG: purine-nucleoside phosphorylase, partial [Oscillospiraceae bacterium]
SFINQFSLPGTFAPIASYNLLSTAEKIAANKNLKTIVGNILSADNFYNSIEQLKLWKTMNVLCVEMEAAALYMNAAQSGKNALAILTISDCPLKNLSCTAKERETTFTDMMSLALDTAIMI